MGRTAGRIQSGRLDFLGCRFRGRRSDLAANKVPALASLSGVVPVPPLAACVVGFLLYWILAKAGLESRKLAMPQA